MVPWPINHGAGRMPAEATLFVSLVVVAFVAFGVTLAWVHRLTTR